MKDRKTYDNTPTSSKGYFDEDNDFVINEIGIPIIDVDLYFDPTDNQYRRFYPNNNERSLFIITPFYHTNDKIDKYIISNEREIYSNKKEILYFGTFKTEVNKIKTEIENIKKRNNNNINKLFIKKYIYFPSVEVFRDDNQKMVSKPVFIRIETKYKQQIDKLQQWEKVYTIDVFKNGYDKDITFTSVNTPSGICLNKDEETLIDDVLDVMDKDSDFYVGYTENLEEYLNTNLSSINILLEKLGIENSVSDSVSDNNGDNGNDEENNTNVGDEDNTNNTNNTDKIDEIIESVSSSSTPMTENTDVGDEDDIDKMLEDIGF
jgi:hypothetical protein